MNVGNGGSKVIGGLGSGGKHEDLMTIRLNENSWETVFSRFWLMMPKTYINKIIYNQSRINPNIVSDNLYQTRSA